ncbi:serine/threonine-protein kinase RsbT [Oikeobacillus pervagus]|uniref:Serine/threonine-protein kinase RsbT n=1 Tax=Oikeobacillus pervagus TaxID=1325931 RepID=A0AAJ1T3U1_9BACI|nr:ATP-binding protein [Oikeobacillus pervagus]MDQ0216116.1 serine/threonine-protein kinase RsbT [Oikeobacillus pervagus]
MYRIAIEREVDIYMASTIGKKLADEHHLNKIEQTKLVVSIMELSRNIIYYADEGEVYITPIPSYGIEVIAIDKGPGIKDLEKVLKNEVPSKKGLGLGLSGVKRLMDEFEIISDEENGTKIRAVKWFNERKVSPYDKIT